MIYEALCRHLGVEPKWNPSQSLPMSTVPSITLAPPDPIDEEILKTIATKVYDLEADHSRMKELLTVPIEERAETFDGPSQKLSNQAGVSSNQSTRAI